MKYLFPILLIGFSLICIGSFYLILSYFSNGPSPCLPIRFIAQTGPVKEGLKTDDLAEILDLSADQPRSLSAAEAEKTLKKNPLIKSVSAAYWAPETLYIDYTLRHPIFVLGDFENIGVDSDGFFFPLRPYFTPKKLPELYLGLTERADLDCPLGEKERTLAHHFLAYFKENLKRIDLSKIEASSLGKREIVVILEPLCAPLQIVRLSPKRYREQLRDYEKLKPHIPPEAMVIDLRIPNLAYLSRAQDDL